MSTLPVEGDGSTREQAFTSVTDRLDKLIALMEAQAKYLQPVVKAETGSKESPAPSSVFQEVSEHLRKIHEKQSAADMASMQPLSQSSATDDSDWDDILRRHMNNVNPIISQWRGTLDTLLIFVGVFSAIVTALYVQSLASLSPDPGERTNELLENLTEVIIVLQGASGVHLNFTQPSAFEPAAAVIRLNFYFSISLVLSISVAALAVTSRGYITTLTRSNHPQADGKLRELRSRWLGANRLLAPAMEALPQLLILSVLLCIAGLLDMLLSGSTPLSNSDALLFTAGIISCFFIVAIGIYTVGTVIHGCTHPNLSPFQSPLSRVIVSLGPGWLKTMKDAPSSCLQLLYIIVRNFRRVKNDYLLPLFNGQKIVAQNDNDSLHHEPVVAVPNQGRPYIIVAIADFYGPCTVIPMHEHEAFHAALHHTHDDGVLDQAAAALLPLAASRFPATSKLHNDQEQALCLIPLQKEDIIRLLSEEASTRSNLTAATAICMSRPFKDTDLLPILQHAAIRYSSYVSGLPTSKELLNCPFTKVMAYILCDERRLPRDLRNAREALLTKAPLLSILLTDRRIMFLKSNPPQRDRPDGVALYNMNFILDVLRNSLEQDISLWTQVDRFFHRSGTTPLLDNLLICRSYRVRPYGNDIGAHSDYWDHPIFAALMLGFSTTESLAGQLLGDTYRRQSVAAGVARWFMKRYYHSRLHSLPVDLSSAIRGILKHPLMDAVRGDHMFFDPEDPNGGMNFSYLRIIFMGYNTAYAQYADLIQGNSAQLASHSLGYLQTAVEVVNFIFLISNVHPCRSSRCKACEKEFSAHNSASSHFLPSLFCAFQGVVVHMLRSLHHRAPFVRLTVEETELVQKCLSRPDGSLPIDHKLSSHSENVRHILLKSFMHFAPEVPVLPHHYYRAEHFGIDDTFMDINWTWFETALDDPTSETNWCALFSG